MRCGQMFSSPLIDAAAAFSMLAAQMTEHMVREHPGDFAQIASFLAACQHLGVAAAFMTVTDGRAVGIRQQLAEQVIAAIRATVAPPPQVDGETPPENTAAPHTSGD
jgi:hypothetical protein